MIVNSLGLGFGFRCQLLESGTGARIRFVTLIYVYFSDGVFLSYFSDGVSLSYLYLSTSHTLCHSHIVNMLYSILYSYY